MAYWYDFAGGVLARSYIQGYLVDILDHYIKHGNRPVRGGRLPGCGCSGKPCQHGDGSGIKGEVRADQLFIFVCEDFDTTGDRYWMGAAQRNWFYYVEPFFIDRCGVKGRSMGKHAMHEIGGVNIPIEFPSAIRTLEKILDEAPDMSPEQKTAQAKVFADTIVEWIRSDPTGEAAACFSVIYGKDMKEAAVKVTNQF